VILIIFDAAGVVYQVIKSVMVYLTVLTDGMNATAVSACIITAKTHIRYISDLIIYTAIWHYSAAAIADLMPARIRPHSVILASCKPGRKPCFRPGFRPGSRQVRAGLPHAFDYFVENLVANMLHQSRHVEIDAAGSQRFVGSCAC